MKTRMTYISVEVADHFADFIIKRDEQVLDAVKTRARDFSTISILKLLYQLKCSPMTFSDLYVKSNIRMKRSFSQLSSLVCIIQFHTKRAQRCKHGLHHNRQGKNYARFVHAKEQLIT